MKNFIRIVTFILAFSASSAYAQTARVQIIHNSADAAAQTVDVYINNSLTFDDFAFRTATPFGDVPANTQLAIGIAPGNSTGPGDIIATFNVTFNSGATYVVVANGIVSPTGYSPATPFNLDVYNLGQETAATNGNTDVLVVHGSTDAPTVDVTNVTALPSSSLIDDLAYGSFSGYLQLPTADYAIQVRLSDGVSPVAQYSAPLQTLGLQNAALVVVASGFLNPANNSNGPAFGLYAALPSGGALVALPAGQISTARVQVIHNCADAVAASVDVYVNDVLAIDDFAFRTATPFIEVDTGATTIKIAPPNSTSSAQALFTKNANITGGSTLYAIASGITNPAGNYNPYVPFDIVLLNDALEFGSSPTTTDVRAFHGATDAPTVDIYEVTTSINNIIDDLAYGASSSTLALTEENYLIQVRTADGQDAVAEYSAPLQTLGLGGQSLLVLASGFLNPAANNNGPAFGLYVALPSGGNLIPLPTSPISTARVQIIHNSADPAAAQVDIVINGNTFLDNFAFRAATPFVDVKTTTTYTIEVKTANGTSTIGSFPNVTLTGGEKYVIMAQGVAGSGFETNTDPDADNNTFNLYVLDGAKEKSASQNNIDVRGVHGSTDAPKVDIIARNITTLYDNISYGDAAAGYTTVPAAPYILDITPAQDNNNIVASYDANLTSLGGKAAVVFASGFLTPANDNNGPAFSLCYALPDGTTGCFSAAVGLDENAVVSNAIMYPNPATGNVTVDFVLKEKTNVQFTIVDALGSVVRSYNTGNLQAGIQRNTLNIEGIANGLYFVRINAGNHISTQKLTIAK